MSYNKNKPIKNVLLKAGNNFKNFDKNLKHILVFLKCFKIMFFYLKSTKSVST